MATVASGLNPEYIQRALVERVVGDIKADLKARIMPQVEVEVDAAVDAIVAALGPSVKATIIERYEHLGRELAISVTTKHIKAE